MLSEGVRLPSPLLSGRLIRRYKRFLADVEIDEGIVVAHCANPGAMTTCAPEGAPVWLSESDNPRRKLRYSWELVDVDGELVSVNTARSNRVVEEALNAGRIPELAGYRAVEREVRWGKSRLDFVLRGAPDCLVEVKTVTLKTGAGECAFPDSVTARGRRHLEELIGAVGAGRRAVLLFLCARAGTRRIRPADEIDPAYGATLRAAAAAGVEVLAFGCVLSPSEIVLGERLPIQHV